MSATEVKFRTCSSKNHVKSNYDKDKVPESLFEYPNNSKKFFKQCFNCREADRLHKNKTRESIKQEKEEAQKTINENFRFCEHLNHMNVSEINSRVVPVELFRENPNDINSKILIACKYCRDADKIRDAKIRANTKAKNIKN